MNGNFNLDDLDLFSQAYVQGAPEIWKELREQCPVARSVSDGGGWLPTKYEDIAAVAYDTKSFSSRDVGVASTPEGTSILVAPPITSDPPFHADARRMLLPFFSPKAVAEMADGTREIARELLDQIDPTSVVDIAEEYARHIPVRVIGSMLGLPKEDSQMFT